MRGASQESDYPTGDPAFLFFELQRELPVRHHSAADSGGSPYGPQRRTGRHPIRISCGEEAEVAGRTGEVRRGPQRAEEDHRRRPFL